jgi:hypothetical protein
MDFIFPLHVTVKEPACCTLLNRKRSHHNFKKVVIGVCDEMTTGNLVGPARYWCQGKDEAYTVQPHQPQI